MCDHRPARAKSHYNNYYLGARQIASALFEELKCSHPHIHTEIWKILYLPVMIKPVVELLSVTGAVNVIPMSYNVNIKLLIIISMAM